MKEKNRVKKYREFKEILELRNFKRNDIFIVNFRKNEFGYARVGILVTKKNGNAVTRVKIKRQVRSIIDECLDYNNTSLDLIVYISKSYDTNAFQENRTKLIDLIQKVSSN